MQPERMDRDGSHQGVAEDVPAAISDTGCERELNEDRYAVVESASGVAWIVADGMGGVSGGELAAQLAIDAMRRHLESNGPRDVEVALRSAVLEANRIIVLRRQNPLFSGMGTTVVVAMFQGIEMSLAHAGDSRAYVVRDGSIHALTQDHTLVQEMVAQGELSVEEALEHPQAHVLTRCLGSEPGLRIDMSKYWIHRRVGGMAQSDRLVLVTDGLYSLVSDAEVAAAVSEMAPQRACVHLVELAKSRGGFDNITIAVIPLEGTLLEEPPPGYEGRDYAKESSRALEDEMNKVSPKRLIVWWIISSVAAAMLVLFIFTLLVVG
jgi:PPM family protein phosphatase